MLSKFQFLGSFHKQIIFLTVNNFNTKMLLSKILHLKKWQVKLLVIRHNGLFLVLVFFLQTIVQKQLNNLYV